jgi:hypothetical protein
MKLRRLSIDRMPGIDRPFELADLGQGLNIVVGPNGIGKSRVCAAVRALLWHERGIGAAIEDREFSARALFAHEGDMWSVVRNGSQHAWQRGGVDAMAPILPGERLEGCFFLGLRDLLDDSDRAGRDLAGEIRRQMSGGFDLEAVHRFFREAVRARAGSRENKDLAGAESEIRRAERNQEEVERRERELENLERRASHADRAAKRVIEVEDATSLHTLRGDLSQCQRELDEFPRALGNLDGRESLRLEAIDEELHRKQQEHSAADAGLASSRESIRLSRLDKPIDPGRMETWRERADKLAEQERQLDAARVEQESARELVMQRRRWLGSRTLPAADPELESGFDFGFEDDVELFGFLQEGQQLTTKIEVARERLGLLAAREFSAEDSRQVELLKRGISPLREWLRAPDPDRLMNSRVLGPSPRIAVILGFAVAAIAVALQFTPAGGPASAVGWTAIGLALGLGLGFAIAGILSLARVRVGVGEVDAMDWRSIAERQFPDSLAPPERWSHEGVDARLRQIEEEFSRLDASEKRSRDRLVERGPLEESLSRLEGRLGELDARRNALAERLGLDSLRSDALLLDLAQGLFALRDAAAEARAREARVSALEGDCTTLLEGLAGALVALGESEPSDAASTRAGLHSLEQRDRTLRAAIAETARERGQRERLDSEIERLDEGRAVIFACAEIENQDRLELRRLLEDLPRYGELKSACAELGNRLDRATAQLEAAGASALILRSVAELAEDQAALELQSAGRDELITQIAEIRKDVREAREGHVLEEALAKKVATLEVLRDRREEALAALAGQFLVDGVRQEHEENQMPRVLARARDRFGVFTHHRYELIVSSDAGGSFVAIEEKSGRGLRPEQLSDGTRAQLILAARLAFAEEAEQGADLPIFLDEAMDHSDPERFHAIACSLARMVMNDARQVFYLSNDPTDVERFQNAFAEVGCERLQTIDLGEIRGQGARVDGPGELRVAPLASVPSPNGLDPADYGAAIGVAPLAPREDPGSHSLYYVLRGDLSLLHDLLVARIMTVGQWTNLARAGTDFAKKIGAGGAVGAELEARIALLETFCLAWREGRGREIGRGALERSGAVSDKFLDSLTDIMTELGGDASRLIAELRARKDARLRGYRSKATDDLERFFEEQGYVDDKPILDESEIVERALATPAANRLAPRVVAELVHDWWSLSGGSAPTK